MSCTAKLCVFNAYHEWIFMCYRCLLQVMLFVVDACCKRSYVSWLTITNECMLCVSYVFWIPSPNEVMCCGCMVLTKSMLKDPCLMGSCYSGNVCVTTFCYCIIRYHGFHCCVVGCCYGQFCVASYVLGVLVSIHFDCIPHRTMWPNRKIFLCLWHVRRTWLKQAYIKINDVATDVATLRSMGEIMHHTNCLED